MKNLMRDLAGIVAGAYLLLASLTPSHAQPIRNPYEVAQRGRTPFKISEELDFSERELKTDSKGIERRANSYNTKISANFSNILEIYGSIGALDSRVTGSVEGLPLRISNKVTPIYGVGGSLLILNKDDWYWALNGNYRFSEPDIKKFVLGGMSLPVDGSLRQQEWQLSTGIAKGFFDGIAVPYGGIFYSDGVFKFDAKVDGERAQDTTQSKGKIGGYGGITINLGDIKAIREGKNLFSITFEGRGGADKAGSIKFRFRF